MPENLSDSIIITKEEIKGGSYKNITWSIDENRKLTVKGTGEFSGSTGYRRAPWYGHKIHSVEISITDMTDASGMFSGCSGLTEIDLSGIDTSKVTNMAYMFSGCSGLTSVDLSGVKLEKVVDISSMFAYCENLTDVNLSGADLSNADFSSANFENASTMQRVFSYYYKEKNEEGEYSYFIEDEESICINLQSINMSNANFGSVTSMGHIFAKASLTDVDLSNADFGKVPSLEGVFSYSYNRYDDETDQMVSTTVYSKSLQNVNN